MPSSYDGKQQLWELPSPELKWSHGTCSREKVTIAVEDACITAIEADIIMGYELTETFSDSISITQKIFRDIPMIPIMSHPPERTSDLKMRDFLILTTDQDMNGVNGNPKSRHLKKHIKLDFKELETVRPTLDVVKYLKIECAKKMIFLNADVLPGPGMRHIPPKINADAFLKCCLDQQHGIHYAFSLGWNTDPRAAKGYTIADVAAMEDVIIRNEVVRKSSGIVLAVNARVLVKDCHPFDDFLSVFPSAQLLVWTATGEPPVSKRIVNKIKGYFEKRGTLDRIGFDCKIAKNVFSGLMYDNLVRLATLHYYTHSYLERHIRARINIEKHKLLTNGR